ncbi:MAG: hypothetical protein ABIQ52_01205 [Vicinamibacterales bacterium]
MAKRNSGTTQTRAATNTTTAQRPATDTLDPRVAAFAEQLGRIAGTMQAKAEGWMDRDALNKQIASVRDGAAQLLDQLAQVAAVAQSAAKSSAAAAPVAPAKGRSGGVVDAPGKKHRKAPPSDPGARRANVQAAKMRNAMPMAKTGKTRGRG